MSDKIKSNGRKNWNNYLSNFILWKFKKRSVKISTSKIESHYSFYGTLVLNIDMGKAR
jgi:hypothetical protein